MSDHVKGFNHWDGTKEQKLWGLMQIWAEVKINFAYFDQVPNLDWDLEVYQRISQVISGKDILEYYKILRSEGCALRGWH